MSSKSAAPGEQFRFRLVVGAAYRARRAIRAEKRERGRQCLRALLELLDARMQQAEEQRKKQRD